ncbi:MAG: response regulator [Candidatus Eremiobacteraeota bacterium]|nr:response regulator [Candidatus Eremiobacteraeota bacterium]
MSFRGKLRVRPRRYRRPFNGYEVCRQLKEHELTRHIPVLFATGATSPEEQQRALQVGGVDFLSKPYHEETVQARVLRYSKLPSL